MYEKFKLKLDDVEAEDHFLNLIDFCYKERMNIVIDKLHTVADWWRKIWLYLILNLLKSQISSDFANDL